MKSLKRAMTFADQIKVAEKVGSSLPLQMETFTTIRDSIQVAKRFVLTDQASAYLGEAIRKNPRLIADAQDFAIPLFENMWIEIRASAFHTAVTGERVVGEHGEHDDYLGFLFRGPVVYVIAGGQESNPERKADVSIMPIRYILNRPPTRPSLEHFTKPWLSEDADGDMGEVAFLAWGEECLKTMFKGLDADEDQEKLEERVDVVNALCNSHTMEFIKYPEGIDPRDVRKAMHTCAGDLRTIIALLLFLNRTRDIQIEKDVPFGSTLYNRKPMPLLSHRVISLSINPTQRFRRLTRNMEPSHHKANHDVRGHFRHDLRARTSGCLHGLTGPLDPGTWVEYEPNRWKCERCGGHRWHVRSHTSGKGPRIITSEYSVTR